LIFLVLRTQLLGPQPLPEPLQQDVSGNVSILKKLKARLSTFDIGGQALFLLGMILLILALTWGGATYAWDSAHVIAPFIIGGLLACAFICWQYLMVPGKYVARKLPLQRPTIPWTLLSHRNVGLLFYINFATGMGMLTLLRIIEYMCLYCISHDSSSLLCGYLFHLSETVHT